MYHFNKYPQNGFREGSNRTEALIRYYKSEFVYPQSDDESLIEWLEHSFTIKRISADELQHYTFMTEMILGSRKPDVYTVLWELTEDDRSRFFYKWRREKYLYGGFDVSGKIVVFYAPAHPLDNEIPARHFASNDPVFDLFINIIKGVDKEDVDTMSIRGRSYAETYALFDELLTEKFGYGNRTLIASDIVFPCEIEVYPGVKNESKA